MGLPSKAPATLTLPYVPRRLMIGANATAGHKLL